MWHKAKSVFFFWGKTKVIDDYVIEIQKEHNTREGLNKKQWCQISNTWIHMCAQSHPHGQRQ